MEKPRMTPGFPTWGMCLRVAFAKWRTALEMRTQRQRRVCDAARVYLLSSKSFWDIQVEVGA